MSPSYGSGQSTERRTAIADAAISLLGTAGIQAMTHRKIDQLIGLPAGSASYYFRSRDALLAAAMDRIVALDDADLTAVIEQSTAIAEGAAVSGRDTALVARLFEVWSAPDRRERLAARFELQLAARRDGAPTQVLDARVFFRRRAQEAFERAGVEQPDRLAIALAALFNGLLLDVLLSNGADRESRHALLVELAAGFAAGGGQIPPG